MQLTVEAGSLRRRLAAATAALLGTSSAAQAAEFRTGLLFYSEFDRVTAFEAAGLVRKAAHPKLDFELGLTVDILTGASPNGATRSDQAQTFTRPSGRGTFVTPAGHTPLDDTFQDNRGALTLDGSWTPRPGSRVEAGGAGSLEYDYRSLALRGAVEQDAFSRNTTFRLAVSHAWDTLYPEGGIPVPFAPMLARGVPPLRMGSSDHKTVLDVVAGVTQVLSPTALGQISYSRSENRGYLGDPFKFTAQVFPEGHPEAGRPGAYLYENRPRARTQHAVFAEWRQHWGSLITQVSYRLAWDDWDLVSHTTDFKVRIPTGWLTVEPHLRFYRQSGVSFFRLSHTDGEPLPDFSTPDTRQGPMTALTAGFRVDPGMALPHWSFRVEAYLQRGDEPSGKIGVQNSHTLYPAVGAVIAQVSYAFEGW